MSLILLALDNSFGYLVGLRQGCVSLQGCFLVSLVFHVVLQVQVDLIGGFVVSGKFPTTLKSTLN
jgi:hypothetical protein